MASKTYVISGFLFFGQILYRSYLISCFNRDLMVSFVKILFTENDLTERMVYGMFFLGRNFVSDLICTLKSKKKLKSLKTLKT